MKEISLFAKEELFDESISKPGFQILPKDKIQKTLQEISAELISPKFKNQEYLLINFLLNHYHVTWRSILKHQTGYTLKQRTIVTKTPLQNPYSPSKNNLKLGESLILPFPNKAGFLKGNLTFGPEIPEIYWFEVDRLNEENLKILEARYNQEIISKF